MKKILSIVLILCCMLAICSCSLFKKGGDNDDNGNTASGLEAFENAVAATNASYVKYDAEVETDLGKLTTSMTVSYNNDGSATITYAYDKFNSIDEGAADEIMSTVSGTILRAADGTYSGDVPEGLDVSGTAASPAINFAPVKDSAVVSEKGDVLTLTVPAANSAEVYGSAFSKDSTLEIFIKGGVVSLMEITFEGGVVTYQYN